MKKQRYIENNGLIVTRFGGQHTYHDAVEALEEIPRINSSNKEIYEIVINDDDIKLDFTKEEVELITKKVKSTFEKYECGGLAIVASHDLVFGMSRMLEMSIINEKIAVAVFRSEELARKWIQEIRAMHDPQLRPES